MLVAVLVAGCSGRTTGATIVTDTTARLNAVGSCDTNCQAFIRWRKAGTSAWTNGPVINVGKATDVPWSHDASGLTADTAYEYQACGKEQSYSGYVCVGPEGQVNAVHTFRTTGGNVRQPPGFTETTVFSGLSAPTAIRFSPDGRVFVAEKAGLIKVFDNLTDTTPTVFADLRSKVFGYWDMGLLGLALAPSFPTDPYVYVMYSYDGPIGGAAPTWNDACPTPPGPMTDGCPGSARLSRLKAAGNTMTGAEELLVSGWCQQYPVHSIGDLLFGADGALYASAGEAAHPDRVDYGQGGGSPNSPVPKNPCGDTPGGVGATLSPPTAEGGALRSQSPRRAPGRPRVLNGTIIRVDPATGAGMPNNPMASSSDANERRIVAYGLRNPFRITRRPGTNELWIGDVGMGSWEEIDRVPDPLASPVRNFGWPCYEGPNRQGVYEAAGLDLCKSLYTAGTTTPPFYAYNHANKVAGESCAPGSSSITGISFQFYSGGPYPPAYDGALFFGDRSRRCIWAVLRRSSTLPDTTRIQTFLANAANPVDLQIGPGGDLFYADFDGGTVRRIRYTAANQPPTAVAQASPTSGPTPLTVQFDANASSDADPGEVLTYSWDLDGDGNADATTSRPTFTYTTAGTYVAKLTVTDPHGATATDTVTISPGNTPPQATIEAPASTFTWAVGDTIAFRGSATDAQDGTLPASALSWSMIMHHCPSNCHTHPIQDFNGVASGSMAAPDHGYPSYLELRLTATDSRGLQDVRSLRLDPKTVDLAMRSSPSGLTLAVDTTTGTTPFTRTVIAKSTVSISAAATQSLGGTTYTFGSWSDGGSATHTITASAAGTYTATYSGG